VHGMGSGKKVGLLGEGAPVCFTVFREDSTVLDAVPCHVDTAYFSVMLFGMAIPVGDPVEASAALGHLVEKYAPGRFPHGITPQLVDRYRSALDGNAVKIFRILPDAITAKENPLDTQP
jgi:uncharacterized protein